ncbi:MAG: hypothetical protein K6G56_05420 [Clostridiales bacterium]|nr:hypothetical protein [Clostridiales bacterium]
MNGLTLAVIVPGGEAARVSCDTVTLTAMDGANGQGGGSMGILPGHIPAVIALEPGSLVTALSGGRPAAAVRVGGGFASVSRDVVTVICEQAETEQ